MNTDDIGYGPHGRAAYERYRELSEELKSPARFTPWDRLDATEKLMWRQAAAAAILLYVHLSVVPED